MSKGFPATAFFWGLPQVKSIQTKTFKNQRRVESAYLTRDRQYYVQDVNKRTHRLQEHVNKQICLPTDTILKFFYGEYKFSRRPDFCTNITNLFKPQSFKSYHFTAATCKWKTWRFSELWYFIPSKKKIIKYLFNIQTITGWPWAIEIPKKYRLKPTLINDNNSFFKPRPRLILHP